MKRATREKRMKRWKPEWVPPGGHPDTRLTGEDEYQILRLFVVQWTLNAGLVAHHLGCGVPEADRRIKGLVGRGLMREVGPGLYWITKYGTRAGWGWLEEQVAELQAELIQAAKDKKSAPAEGVVVVVEEPKETSPKLVRVVVEQPEGVCP